MPDHTPEGEEVSVEERIEELEDTIETLEQESQGRNQLEITAYDLTIKGSSEDTDMSELLKMFSSEMENLTERALIGQYQEIEREDLFSHILGDD